MPSINKKKSNTTVYTNTIRLKAKLKDKKVL